MPSTLSPLSKKSAFPAFTNVGLSIEGMPSLSGPPENIWLAGISALSNMKPFISLALVVDGSNTTVAMMLINMKKSNLFIMICDSFIVPLFKTIERVNSLIAGYLDIGKVLASS